MSFHTRMIRTFASAVTPVVTFALLAGVLGWVEPAHAAGPPAQAELAHAASVAVRAVAPSPQPRKPMPPWTGHRPIWPTAASSDLDLRVRPDGTGLTAASASVGGLAVRVEPLASTAA